MGGLSKSIRLNKLAQVLGSRRHYLTAPKLAEMMGVTERTIYRDMEDLDRLGYSVYYDRGYKTYPLESAPSIPFSDRDVSTLQLLIESSPLFRLPFLKERIKSIFTKLLVPFAPDKKQEKPIQYTGTAARSQVSFDVSQLEKAIQNRRALEIVYYAMDDVEPTPREIHPYVIVIRNGNWYLIGYSVAKGEPHLYRLERIHKIRVLNQSFQRDPSFRLDEYFASDWGVYRGKPIRVTLRFRNWAARLAREQLWPSGSQIKTVSPDDVRITTTVYGTHEILGRVLFLCPDVEVLKPKSLRDELRKILEASLKLHQ